MTQQCNCGTRLYGWRFQGTGQAVRARAAQPLVCAASADDATRGWYWTAADSPRPAHDVLTGGAAAEIMVYGACREGRQGGEQT